MNALPADLGTYVERNAPAFVKAVRSHNHTTIETTLAEFHDDFALLYACLMYASAAGATVTFAPLA